jgi:hypothetical protein
MMDLFIAVARGLEGIGRRLGRVAPLGCAALVAGSIASASAAAGTSVPRYSLRVVEGETTQPEDSIVYTSGRVEHRSAQVRVSIIRNGATVYQDTGSEGAWLSQVPQAGDVLTLESPVGTVIGSVPYDGLPSLDATVCAGSTDFSGQRSASDTVEGGYFTEVANVSPYGTSYERRSHGYAQVTLLSGSSFGGNFLTPLVAGQTVYASESLEVPLANGAVFVYESENVRPVGACPPPPLPPPVQPVVPPLQAGIAGLVRTTLRALLRHGLSDRVEVNQPGTVVQDLYLLGGALPAHASSHRRAHRRPALLLARGSARAKGAGKVTVTLRLTARGRGRLRAAKAVRAVLVTTVHSASGQTLDLPRRSLTLHR